MIRRVLIVGTIVVAILTVALKQASAASTNAGQNSQVAVKSIEVHPNDVQTQLCMDMPSLEPWNPYATLTVDGTVTANSEVALVNAKDPTVMKSQNRCYLFTFQVSVTNSPSHRGTLRLEKFWLELGQGLLTDDVVATIKSRVQQSQPQLDFKVLHTTGNRGGGAGIQILSKPSGMSDAQAIGLIEQASIDQRPGNWQLDIDLK